ncbi:MAG: SDR family oxidoreductase [bacterium]
MERVIITGAWGNLGRVVVPLLAGFFKVFPLGRRDGDITDFELLKAIFNKTRPSVVIHLAAITDIDVCEEAPEVAYNVNVEGTRNVVRLCEKFGARLIFTSSPFVFDGKKEGEYIESDIPNPLNIYGKTKLNAEKIVLDSSVQSIILRLGWLFGPYIRRFSSKLIKSIIKEEPIELATDSFFSPLYTIDCAHFILNAIVERRTGIIHLSNDGMCSSYEFGCYLAEKLKKKKPLTTRFENLKFKVHRPINFSISSQSGLKLRHWKEAIDCFIEEIKEKPFLLFS